MITSDEYTKQWLQQSLSTQRVDWIKAEQDLRDCCIHVGLQAPRTVIRTDSPLGTRELRHHYQRLTMDYSSRKGIGCALTDRLWHNLVHSFDLSTPLQRVAKELALIKQTVLQHLTYNIYEVIRQFLWGALWHGDDWSFGRYHCGPSLCYIAYLREVHGMIKETQRLEPFLRLCEQITWMGFVDDTAILCDRPIEIHLKDFKLHRDGGPAIQWADGFAIYALHGVVVPKWLAMTPVQELDLEEIHTIFDRDIISVFLRKLGLEQPTQATAACVLDQQEHDALLEIELNYSGTEVYLKRFNKHTQRFDFEETPATCRTVRQALNWLKGNDELPI